MTYLGFLCTFRFREWTLRGFRAVDLPFGPGWVRRVGCADSITVDMVNVEYSRSDRVHTYLPTVTYSPRYVANLQLSCSHVASLCLWLQMSQKPARCLTVFTSFPSMIRSTPYMMPQPILYYIGPWAES